MEVQTLRVYANGVELPASSIGLPLVIQHGRSGTDTQPDAPQLRFIWCEPTLPLTGGNLVEVFLDLPTGGTHTAWASPDVPWSSPGYTWEGAQMGVSQRFKGRVSDIQAVEQDGNIWEWDITCTGVQAELGRKPINISRPAETDVERVQAIAAAAEVPVMIIGGDPVNLTADNIAKDALGALHEVAGWTGGLVWQGRDGTLMYGTRSHREGPAQSIIPAGAIVDGIQWATTVRDVVNHCVVTFGEPQTQNTYRDDASIAQWGFRHVEISTKLLGESEANEFGNTIIARRAQPFWAMPGIYVNSLDCSVAEHYDVNLLAVSMGVILPIQTSPAPIGVGDVEVWTVEGWIETWSTPSNQQLQIAVSDRQRWGAYALNRWSEQVLHDWQFWLDNGTWLEQLTYGN